ncbi:Coproporphyrinogen III oxidase [Planctomycetales bacterium 10988]|nr:Coproporphyrinogen III oxidase [Planctomycetales bacterium 10988]
MAAEIGKWPPAKSAYVHIPFCAHRCGYCNFTLVAKRDDLIKPYLEALQVELTQQGDPLPVETLYLGGGTPSYLPLPEFEQFLKLVTKWFPLEKDGEFTCEVNPVDITAERIAKMADYGINRLSFGAQSFSERSLKLLERDHSAEKIQEGVALASRSIPAICLDLIFAVPGQTLDDWKSDLQAAIAMRPGHLSTYGLTFEPGTSFWHRRDRGELSEVEEETQTAMYLQARKQLQVAGFEHYEVSNFAVPGQRSRHNQVYWSGKPYAAVGPGAARYLKGVRETNERSVSRYIKKLLAGDSPTIERETLSAEARACEWAVFGLRRLEGITRAEFAQVTGFELDLFLAPVIQKFVEMELLTDDGERVQLTEAGLLVSDQLWPDFFLYDE